MKNLNIPLPIKEIEFSSLSSYKECTVPRQFYIQVLVLKAQTLLFKSIYV